MIYVHRQQSVKINRKIVIAGRYLGPYQIKDETVYVDYILDCHKDYDWLIH